MGGVPSCLARNSPFHRTEQSLWEGPPLGPLEIKRWGGGGAVPAFASALSQLNPELLAQLLSRLWLLFHPYSSVGRCLPRGD